MERFFILYPEVYIKIIESKTLLLNTSTKEYCVFLNEEFSNIHSLSSNRYLPERLLPTFNNVLKPFGYLLEARIPPIVFAPDCKILSSLQKYNEATGANDGKDILKYINKLRFFFPLSSISKEALEVLGYPYYRNNSAPNFVDTYKWFVANFPIQNTTTIEVVGTFGAEMFSFIDFLSQYHIDCYIKCFINSQSDLETFYELYYRNNENLCAIVFLNNCSRTHLKDLDNVIFIDLSESSIVADENTHLSPDDILNNSGSIDSITKNSIINSNAFGVIDICPDEILRCNYQVIGEVNDFDHALYKWINSPDCIWRQTRSTKGKCRGCLLQDVCPPITIAECSDNETLNCDNQVSAKFTTALNLNVF